MEIENIHEELSPEYIKGEKLGEGTYGEVYKGVHKTTGEIVAIKKVKLTQEDEGISSTTLREIAILKTLKHSNVVCLQDMYYAQHSRKLSMIFEFVDRDLRKYIDSFKSAPLPLLRIKIVMEQILVGLAYCHGMRVLHRDLKPQNILISKEGKVKIGDFGLARTFAYPFKGYTRDIVTLWYRSPEILLGAEKYSVEIDMWSVGCIFAELLKKKPLFMGDSQIGQLYQIFKLFGTPTESAWPGFASFTHFTKKFPKFKARVIEEEIPDLDAESKDLLLLMLKMNPSERITAKEALNHPFFDDIKQLNVSTQHL